jgi:hypothetical protein
LIFEVDMKNIIFLALISFTLSGCGIAQIAISPYGSVGKVVAAGVVASSPTQGATYEYPYQNK